MTGFFGDGIPPAMEAHITRLSNGDYVVTQAHDYDHALYADVVEGQDLRDLLDLLVSPVVAPLGLKWRGDHHWVGESQGGIRHVRHYSLLKGARGTFQWGVCLDFVKVPSGNKLVFNRTERSASLHLFERAPAYVDTFHGLHIARGEGFGIGCHVRRRAELTIRQSIAHVLEPIWTTLGRMSTLGGVITEARRQIEETGGTGNIYGNHSPRPAYVLAFCLSRLGRHDDALATLASIQDSNDFFKLGLVEAHLRMIAKS